MDKKKIVIIGSNHVAALELIFKKQLEQMGYEVILFPAQTMFLSFYNLSLWNKILFRLDLSKILSVIQMALKNLIIVENPSLVIVFKGMEVKPSTLIWMKERGIIICNYNPDHPFIFSGKGSGNKCVSESITLFDYYISYADDVVDRLKNQGVKSFKLPFGFNDGGFIFDELVSDNEVLKCCFLGNADKYRVHFLNQLANLGLEIDVYGENWHSFKINKTITIGPPKYGRDFWKTLQLYSVQLNLLRPHNCNSHNMRSFDIPGAGGIMLAPTTNDHKSFFEENRDVFLFDSLEMAFEKAQIILNLSFDERQIIRKSARIRALKFHKYEDRVNQFISNVVI